MKKRRCVWNGTPYASISDASKATGYHYATLREYIVVHGYTCDDDVGNISPLDFVEFEHEEPVRCEFCTLPITGTTYYLLAQPREFCSPDCAENYFYYGKQERRYKGRWVRGA